MPPRNSKPDLHESATSARIYQHCGGVSEAKARNAARVRAVRLGAAMFFAASLILFAAAALAPRAAHAAGLGRLTVRSQLGQPLSADIEVVAVGRDEAPSLQVRLASQAEFKQADLDFNPALTQLHFDLQSQADGAYAVHVSSAQAVNEPYLDLLVELSWASGRVVREYTVLLDPPGLRQTPQIIAPTVTSAPVAEAAPPAPGPAVTTPVAPPPSMAAPVATAPAVPAVAPAPLPTPASQAAAPAPTPTPALAPTQALPLPSEPVAQRAPAPTSQPATVHVKTGDTLSKIALANLAPEVSLDQMLVALLRRNPGAFIQGNMNLVLAGKEIVVPTGESARAIGESEAEHEVAAQSADFAAYRSRLAQAVSTTPAVPEKQATAAAQGRVTAKVQDLGAAAKSGDQLKIAKAESGATGAEAAAAKKDEEVARQRALKEEQDRAAALKKANEDIRRANEDRAKQEAAAKAEADKAAKAKADAEKAAAARAAEAAKAAPPPPAVATVTTPAPKPEPTKAPAPAPASPGFLDSLSLDSPAVLAGAGAVLLAALVGLNIVRRRRGAGLDQFKSEGEAMAANSLFGAAGGQSVDTGATSTFNSSFIPAASQLDSNEVDPVAEADVYVAYGREEQAEDILKEALRLQPDRHAVRLKLLEIYSRRGDTASFNAVAQELHDRTGGSGEEWERAAKLGKSLDPSNPLYAGAVGAETAARSIAGPTTDIRMPGATTVPFTEGLVGPTTTTRSNELDFDTVSRSAGEKTRVAIGGRETVPPDTALPPETTAPAEMRAAATRPRVEARVAEAPSKAAQPAGIDFGNLDFDLGPSKLNVEAQTVLPVAEKDAEREEALGPGTGGGAEPPTIPSLDLMFPPTTPAPSGRAAPPPTVTGSVPIPNLDLNLPAGRPDANSAGSLEEALARPTLVGAVGGLAEGDTQRLVSNTDQATVPLIDFDLTGADAAVTGRRTETQAGSPMASQMATKLDLARGYIDLGVKDGARELLEEVMKDGTREQRQQAVELIKLVEA